MKRLPIWFERAESLAIAAAAVVAFVHLHFSWWWLPVLFLAFDASMAGYLIGNRAGAALTVTSSTSSSAYGSPRCSST